MTEEQKLKLPFDLYTRNFIVASFLKSFRDNKGLKILDVGGREGKMRYFVEEVDKLYILDILPPLSNEENYIVGDAKDIPFKNKEFDVVLLLDTYEHIPKEDRPQVLSEIIRVAKNGVIINTPFYSKSVISAEKLVNNFFLKMHKKPHPWLGEHIQFGLPHKHELEQFLKEGGYRFLTLDSNNLNTWLLFQLILLFMHREEGHLPDELGSLFKFYNQYFPSLGHFRPLTYHRTYVVSKKENKLITNLPFVQFELDESLYQQFLFQAFSNMVNLEDRSEKIMMKESKELYTRLLCLKSELANSKRELAQKKEEIERVRKHATQLETILNNIKSAKTFKLWQAYAATRRKIKEDPLSTLIKLFKIALRGPGAIRQKIESSTWQEIEVRDLDVQYKFWLEKHKMTDRKIKLMEKEMTKFQYKPLISIIMPVYNTPEEYLIRAIESVRSQAYPNWQLCIADDASTELHVKRILKEYMDKDKRIQAIFRRKNGQIAAASNSALKLAEGEFVGILDHDDEYWPNALFETVALLNKHPDADLIYCDEDKIDENGKHFGPFFKPDWSPDLLMSIMYLTHFLALRKSFLEKIGGFREEFAGAQDWDLILRASEKTDKISHIPTILYSWRRWEQSTASAQVRVKPYAYAIQKTVLGTTLRRRKLLATVDLGPFPGSFSILYKTVNKPLVSIIISTKDKAEFLKQCVDGVLSNKYTNFEILIVDNRSTENATFKYFNQIKKNPKIHILKYDKPFNISKIYNYAVKKANGELILLLNNDIKSINNNWLERMVGYFQRNDVGGVGAKLLFPDGSIQHCGVILGMGRDKVAGHPYYRHRDHLGYAGFINLVRNYSAVTGACFMTRKKFYLDVGGFEEESLKTLFNDVDFCLKLREKGYLIIYDPNIVLYHFESASLGKIEERSRKVDPKEVQYMREKWGRLLDNDPYYNPNLSLQREDFSLRESEL